MKQPTNPERHPCSPLPPATRSQENHCHIERWHDEGMEPELSGTETISQYQGPHRHVDEVGDHSAEDQETNVHLRISEQPTKKPQAPSNMPKEHGSGDEDPATVDTTRHLFAKGLFLFCP